MNIRCPHCQTVFRVNPDRIPAAGVRAKCARCGDTFLVTRPPADAPREAAPPRAAASAPPEAPRATAATETAPPAAPAGPAVAATRSGAPAERPLPAASVEAPAATAVASVLAAGVATEAGPPAEGGATASPAAATGASPREAQPGAAGPAETRGTSFGARDPRAKAERLARALVSDIVAYHPERRDQSLTSGSLRSEFREEIMKSWEEYVAQVGIEVAKSTPYFRDALNNILAKGQRIF
jgi:predicted Zn finger-like uncharacterized protein